MSHRVSLENGSPVNSNRSSVSEVFGSHTGHHAPSHTLPQIPPTPSSADSSAATAPPKISLPAQGKVSKWNTSWWWWWELGSALLSMGSMFSIVIILAAFENRPLADWTIPIQINSLIATLTTIAKTAMFVAVAESISQLKWLHFYQRARPLHRFQDFEDASRGPWGALTLLYTTNLKAILASIGAVITILGLGIEPMAQQVLAFPDRNVTLTNSTASLGIAEVYNSKAFGEGQLSNIISTSPYLLRLQGALLNGITGNVTKLPFDCPSSARSCSWPSFSTLGVCSSCSNITDFKRNCTRASDTGSSLLCDYSSSQFPEMYNQRNIVSPNEHVLRMQYDQHLTEQNNQSMLYVSVPALRPTGTDIISLRTTNDTTSDASGVIPPAVVIEHCSWDWCIRDYESVTATGGILSEPKYTSRSLSGDTGEGVLPGDGQVPYQEFNETINETRVLIATIIDTSIWEYIYVPLNTTVSTQDSRSPQAGAGALDYGNYLYNGNMDTIASGIADTITYQLRSQDLDNYNATSVLGQVIQNETYIQVLWPWLILPLLETVLAAGLLFASMLMARGRPLWKSSALASYVHPLEGWRDDELATDGESEGSVEKVTSGMTVALDRNEEGQWRMLRR